jgi:putative glycerol-1-phosphate prenyltransferase
MNLLKESDRKKIALLIDPDKISDNFTNFIQDAVNYGIDFFFVGGSIVNSSVENIVLRIKEITSKVPVILFPGDSSQFTNKADAILYLSLISGRNPEYLIGQHVKNSIEIKKSNVEIIPTAYILIDGGKKTSVQKVSQTNPIPADDINLAVSTAVAGELLGMQAIYLESGSGAIKTVPSNIINAVKSNIDKVLIVGGGIRSKAQIAEIIDAGADIIVVGNSLEENPEMLKEFIDFTHSKNN